MALSFTNFKRLPPMKGGMRIGFVDIAFDNSYPDDGEAVTAANLGLNTLWVVIPQPALHASNLGFIVSWSLADGKLRVYESGTADAGLAELDTGSSAIDGLVIRCMYAGW